MTPDTRHLLTTRDVADRLGLSVRQVHRYARDGRLPVAYRVPRYHGDCFFDPQDVNEFEQKLERMRELQRAWVKDGQSSAEQWET